MTLIYTATAMFALCALASLAVDVGRVQLVKTELQRAADAAARAAASQLSSGIVNTQTAAVLYGADNDADENTVSIDSTNDVEFGTWNSGAKTFSVLTGAARSSANAVRVKASRTAAKGNAVPLIFANLIGRSRCDVTATSIALATPTNVNYSAGFTGGSGITLNNNAVISGSVIRLTDLAAYWESGSFWYNTPVPINNFTCVFTFQLTSAVSDGFTFCIQDTGTSALGSAAGNLGYGGMAGDSVAVKFDIHDNAGEGNSSTGVYLDGATPQVAGSFDTLGSSVNLKSGNTLKVTLAYDGTTLTETIKDLTAGTTFTKTYTVDIEGAIGTRTAYIGFTAGTGGSKAIQDIKTLTYISRDVVKTVD